jgi:hypothetical protein
MPDETTQRLPTTQPPPNTRADPRADTDVRATVVRGHKKVRFKIDNLSAGGARLIGPLALQKGQHIAITLELDAGTFTLAAEVVRVETPDLLTDQIAVRFIDATREAKTAIYDVVQRHEAENDDDDRDVVVIDQGEA